MNHFYQVVRTLGRPLVKLLYPFTVSGLDALDFGERLVLCANHASGWDPILLCMALPKTVQPRIMAKKELMELPIIGWLLKKLGVFAVDRGNSDLAAIKTAIKAVRDGETLMVFPEGTRVEHEGQVRPKGGAAMIAMRTGAALVPVYVGGKKRLLQRTDIVFGTPLRPWEAAKRGTAEEYQRYADEVMHRAYALGGTAE